MCPEHRRLRTDHTRSILIQSAPAYNESIDWHVLTLHLGWCSTSQGPIARHHATTKVKRVRREDKAHCYTMSKQSTNMLHISCNVTRNKQVLPSKAVRLSERVRMRRHCSRASDYAPYGSCIRRAEQALIESPRSRHVFQRPKVPV